MLLSVKIRVNPWRCLPFLFWAQYFAINPLRLSLENPEEQDGFIFASRTTPREGFAPMQELGVKEESYVRRL